MYQIQTQQRGNLSLVINYCEIWRELPPEEKEFIDEAESLITAVTAEKKLTPAEIAKIISLTFPNWKLGRTWILNRKKDNEGEF